MHIQDGFLNPPVIVSTYVVSGATLAYLWRKIQQKFEEQSVPKVAILASFIFIAQMINIPVSGGTSGHLLGGFLAALLVGPQLAIFILSLVFTVQMLIFQDGGLTALGANILNMGIIGVGSGYFTYRFLLKALSRYRHRVRAQNIAIFCGGWISVFSAAVACGFELSWSGLAGWKVVVPLMAGVHALIGVLEGVMTVLIIEAIRKIRPDFLYQAELEKATNS